ncbi:phage holin family protein [Streptomyces zhihengii]|uniref:Phage holin family protein n=1 Tax=Streptomyces zhihengii TaxID=1818004 RepID=A0ABS2V220_9ACTN|nr:phage holin family protein [Streptomyces zhihengii]
MSRLMGTSPSRRDESVAELVADASQQMTRLVREEFALAKAEMQEKGKRAGRGGGLFGGAGLTAVLALQVLVATVVIALDLVWPLWLAALVVTAVLFVVAGVLALLGKKEVRKAGSPAPERTVDSVKADAARIKESAHR